MNPKKVRAAKADLDERRACLVAEQEKLNVDYRALQRLCGHPNAFKTSHMGESCTHCPDCGNCP